MSMRQLVLDRLVREFGEPDRAVVKVKSWSIGERYGIVLQVDQPASDQYALVWLPYPSDGRSVPENALEYPGEAGRHSGTYPVPGLAKGEPAIRLRVEGARDLNDLVTYVRDEAGAPLRTSRMISIQEDQFDQLSKTGATSSRDVIDPTAMPVAAPPKPRREAIPRMVQREVWQRDGGRCVECHTRERLCFDHIVPFSKGGGNSVRNIQLLCERCNLTKSNRI
ncbi:MAG: HNH endonuclease signature motif containing protein [Micropepsaceae bacterium]